MESKRRLGSERVQPDGGHYLAVERACQGAFSTHPKGMALLAHRIVEPLDRSYRSALRDPPRVESSRSHVTILVSSRSGP